MRGRRLCQSCVEEMLALAPGDAGYGAFVAAIASIWVDILGVEKWRDPRTRLAMTNEFLS